MKIDVLTLFPEVYDVLTYGIVGRALNEGLFEVQVTNIRDYTLDRHRHCDDTPFGGGAGMVMTPQPIADAIRAVDPEHKALRIYLSPKGQCLTTAKAQTLATCDRVLLLNGSYEGVDQRVLDHYIDEELSIGDYVLTSGDLASLVVINAVSRFVDNVLGSSDSLLEESFNDNLLEYPQYTRPQVFEDSAVPEVLLNGNHAHISAWRLAEQLRITAERRPDMYAAYMEAHPPQPPKPKRRKKKVEK